MAEEQKKLNFIRNYLPKLIIERNEEFKNHSVVKCEASAKDQIDGFMAAIYFVELVLKDENGSESSHQIVLKLMKGDQDFREKTKAIVQCSNEVFIYKQVIPYFKSFLKAANVPLDDYQWVPRIYFADSGVFEGLSDGMETVLALENLTPLGYRMGPRLDLDEAHLKLMTANIARYHSVSYAMKIKKDPKLEELEKGLTPLSFLGSDGSELESYAILFDIALERFYRVIDENEELQKKTEFIQTINKMKEKMGTKAVKVMESLLKVDEHFSVHLHGDYNRNNVLFQYPSKESFNNVQSVRMIDFQETRFATPIIDLVFFMYMNMPSSIRDPLWNDILKLYHETVMESLTKILKCSRDDPSLAAYSFDKFLDHFRKHAFYGLMVTIHFIPWIDCSDEECEKIAELFETDMKGPEMRHILQISGGDKVDKRLIANGLHAFENGYLKIFD